MREGAAEEDTSCQAMIQETSAGRLVPRTGTCRNMFGSFSMITGRMLGAAR